MHADHPTLNRDVAELLAAGERIDVLSTHCKYAPSQAQWLRPLDDLVDVGALAPKAVDLCRFDGDAAVRAAQHRRARAVVAPIASRRAGDVGRARRVRRRLRLPRPRVRAVRHVLRARRRRAAGRLFDDDARPVIDVATRRSTRSRSCARSRARAPDDLPDWHYDQVDAALLDGRVDAAAAWPGGYGPIRDSARRRCSRRIRTSAASRTPACTRGRSRRRAATSTAPRALIASSRATTPRALDASGGNGPRARARRSRRSSRATTIDARRLAITRDTIANAMITYPPLGASPRSRTPAGRRSTPRCAAS